MTPSSSTEPGPSTADPGPTSARPFLPVGRTEWLRLVLVVLLGLAAMLAPSALARTGAFYTDSSTVSGDLTAAPTFSPSPSPA